MCSVIESKLVVDVFTDGDYAMLAKTARINLRPYVVQELTYEDFKKMDVFPVDSIRPGRKAGDPTVHDLRGLKYLPNGKIKFKLKLNNDVKWEVLPQRINTQAEVKWVQIMAT